MGPCLCGDPYCGSCGPAQGFNPELLAAEEALADELEKRGLTGDQLDGLVTFILEREEKLRAEEREQALSFVKPRVSGDLFQLLKYEITSGEFDIAADLEEDARLADEYWQSQA